MACAAVLVICLTKPVEAGPEAKPENLGGLIDDAVARVPACVGLAVGLEHGDQRAQRFYGQAGDHGAPDAGTEFEIGSITKTFTATLLAFEDQQGRMHIGDPLASYAPSGMQVPAFEGQPILLLHLADHTSGLPRLMPIAQPPLMPEAMWRFVGTYRLARPPGAQYLCSNLGFGLLARAIVRRESASEDQLYARIITRPLGMRDTAIALTSAQHARLARGYRADRQPALEDGPGFPAMAGAGAVRSTLNDMMRYLDFELGKLNLPLNSLLPALHQARHAAGGNGMVGLGWEMHERADGLNMIYKDGAMLGYSSFMVLSPSLGAGAVILSNQAGCQVTEIGRKIMGGMNGYTGAAPDLRPSDDEN
jgi:serine-type D-Ala-D-Ala carboxypeptidase/endopeptidase